MARLSVKIDTIGILQQAAKAVAADPVAAAVFCELAGAGGIVVHLREDRKYLKESDLQILRRTVRTRLILQMAPSPEMAAAAFEIKPDQVVLVAEDRHEPVVDKGLDLEMNRNSVAEISRTLQEGDIPVGVLVDPDLNQIKLAHQLDAAFVVLNAGPLGRPARNSRSRNSGFGKLVDAAKLASRLKLGICAGGGLDYESVRNFRELHEISDFFIGRSIFSRAILLGLDRAVREMTVLIGDI